jgi:hypothetical protein
MRSWILSNVKSSWNQLLRLTALFPNCNGKKFEKDFLFTLSENEKSPILMLFKATQSLLPEFCLITERRSSSDALKQTERPA